MARPVKWSRDLHAMRERASQSRTETWSRLDIEALFGVGRASAQTLMKAIGTVQSVGAAHFVDRAALLDFLNEMIAADSVEYALRAKLGEAAPAPHRKSLRVVLPADLRNVMLPDLPDSITLEPGRLTVHAETAEAMLEALVLLAQAMGNDLERFRLAVEPIHDSAEVQAWIEGLRERHAEAGTHGAEPSQDRIQMLSIAADQKAARQD